MSRIWKIQCLIALFGILFARPSFAEMAVFVEKIHAIELETKGDKVLPLFRQDSVFRYKSLDLNTLEALAVSEPSHVYEFLPAPSLTRFRYSFVNLLQMDMPLNTPWRVDLRVSSKISLESRTRWFDALAVSYPHRKRVSLGLGHRFSPSTSINAFFDPISSEILAIIAHKIRPDIDFQMLFYRDQRIDKNEAIASLKFLF